MSDLPTITRAQLLEAARIMCDEGGADVELRARVMAVAADVEYVSAGWRARLPNGSRCGCLIGTLRMREELDPIPGEYRYHEGYEPRTMERRVGEVFPVALTEALIEDGVLMENERAEPVYRVIDPESEGSRAAR